MNTAIQNIRLLGNGLMVHTPICFHHCIHAGNVVQCERGARPPQQPLIVIKDFLAISELNSTTTAHLPKLRLTFQVHQLLSPWWWWREVPPKRWLLQDPRGITTQKMAFFMEERILKFLALMQLVSFPEQGTHDRSHVY
jgi:hypothetical protein